MNIADMFQYSVNMILIVVTIFEIDWPSNSQRRVIASISCLVIWMKMFDWLRLFDATSFYIKLIMQTIKDIMPFMSIFPFFMFTVGTSVYILNMEREDDSEVMDEYLGQWTIDVFISQYLLALGDWDTGSFSEGSNKQLIYVFFLVATFLTAITALNMLIAIMGDTFGKVLEGHQKHSREMKISILADYINQFPENAQK